MASEHEPLLFDLPRGTPPPAAPGARPPFASGSGQLQIGDLPLDVRRGPGPKVVPIDPDRRANAAARESAATSRVASSALSAQPQSAGATDGGLVRRFGAAVISGALQIGGVGLTLSLAWRLFPVEAPVWPAAAVFALLWSLAFVILPLAFFRRTVGMALCGLSATSLDRGPLSFGQATRRWFGGLLTVALLGLPGLLALWGRSFSDRVSGSRSVLA
jgi:uncharacterized RDD family membrane protein YckC